MTEKVLLVEDSAAMRAVIEEILEDRIGSVHWVSDGREVLPSAAEIQPDTIVLDISLPGISGLILLPMLRAAHPESNIVMLTNHADELYRRQALARGANAYVLKSHANTDLLPAIRAGGRSDSGAECSMSSHPADRALPADSGGRVNQ